MYTSYICQIKLISYDVNQILKNLALIKNKLSTFNEINIKVSFLPTKKRVYTVLRSPHIDKKSREQFELRKYSYLINLTTKNEHINENIIHDIKSCTEAGISMKIKFFQNEWLTAIKK